MLLQHSGFSTNYVSELSGLTLRQLQWYDEQGLLVPLRKQDTRQYSYRQLVEAALMNRLREKLSLRTVRKVVAALRRDIMKRVEDHLPLPTDLCVITDGDRLKIGSASQMIEWLKESRKGAHLVAIGEEIRRIDSELDASGFSHGEKKAVA